MLNQQKLIFFLKGESKEIFFRDVLTGWKLRIHNNLIW